MSWGDRRRRCYFSWVFNTKISEIFPPTRKGICSYSNSGFLFLWMILWCISKSTLREVCKLIAITTCSVYDAKWESTLIKYNYEVFKLKWEKFKIYEMLSSSVSSQAHQVLSRYLNRLIPKQLAPQTAWRADRCSRTELRGDDDVRVMLRLDQNFIQSSGSAFGRQCVWQFFTIFWKRQ